jgi:hypothetical protein
VRALVPVTNAIAGIDLAGSKQMVLVTDHDSKVIARKTFRCRAWDLGSALDWAAARAVAAGWAGVTVSCEPTGHRWRVLGQLDTGVGHSQRRQCLKKPRPRVQAPDDVTSRWPLTMARGRPPGTCTQLAPMLPSLSAFARPDRVNGARARQQCLNTERDHQGRLPARNA